METQEKARVSNVFSFGFVLLIQLQHNFQLSPDFRPRASSNASSCGGRLSPILGVNETGVDLHDNQVPPMSPWSLDYAYNPPQYGSPNVGSLDRVGAEQLAGSLANTMKLSNEACFMPPPNVTEYGSAANSFGIQVHYSNLI